MDENVDRIEKPQPLSRRELISRGAKIGAVAWVIPAVTVLSVDEAAAATASGGGGGTQPRPPRPPRPPRR